MSLYGGISPATADILGGPLTLPTIVHALTVGRTSLAINYAAICIMGYDMLLTLPAEVRLFWKGRISLLKGIFLVNRYLAPAMIAANIYCSGNATGLTDGRCRDWFSVAAIIETLCIASVSFMMSFRLWSWYQMSTKTLYFMLTVWASVLLASIGVLIDLIWVHREDLIHEPFLNVCLSTYPLLWPQWLPATIEQGFYAVFLFFNAMGTPRSDRVTSLAILYRDGIIFYILTFMTSMFALLLWALAPKIYMGLGLYFPWIIFQILISRLLLNVKTSQVFASRGFTTSATDSRNGGATTTTRSASRQHQHHRSRSSAPEATPLQQFNIPPPIPSDASGVELESNSAGGRRVTRVESRSTVGGFRRRFWWLFREKTTRDIHVDVMEPEDEYGDEEDWLERHRAGGVKDSRLGRRDGWI